MARPAAIQLGLPLAPAKALDDVLDLQKLGLRILSVLGAGERTLGTGAQLVLEVADLGIRTRSRLEPDIAPGVVVDLGQRLVDARNAFLDLLAFAGQLRLEIGHLADGVLVEQFLEARFETRQVVGFQCFEHGAVFESRLDTGIHLLRFQPVGFFVFRHHADDLLAHGLDALVFCVDARLQPFAHFTLPVVAGLDAQMMLAQGLGPQFIQSREARRMLRSGGVIEQGPGLRAQGLGILLFLFGPGAFGLPGFKAGLGYRQLRFQFASAARSVV